MRLAELRRACAGRPLKQLCLPRRLAEEELREIEDRVGTWSLEKGDCLYRTGDPLSAFFIVRCGSLQAHIFGPNGARRVLGFYLPGEAAGLGALRNGRHMTECVALETSTICTIPSYRLEELCALLPRFRDQVRRLMSRAVCGEHRLLLCLDRLHRERRLAAFLLDLAQRHRRPGDSPLRFHLPMAQTQIASFLGTSTEYVNQAFAKLSDSGILNIQGNEVSLLNLPGLFELCRAPTLFRRLLSAP